MKARRYMTINQEGHVQEHSDSTEESALTELVRKHRDAGEFLYLVEGVQESQLLTKIDGREGLYLLAPEDNASLWLEVGNRWIHILRKPYGAHISVHRAGDKDSAPLFSKVVEIY